MNSMHHLDDIRGRISGKFAKGRKMRNVARKFNIAHSIVSRLWTAFQKSGIYTKHTGGGLLSNTTSQEDRYIFISAKKDRCSTAGQLESQLLLPQVLKYRGKLL